MRVLKKLFLFTVLVFSIGSLFAEPPKPPRRDDDRDFRLFKGRRMADDERKFIPNLIRVRADSEYAFLEMFFTQPVDAQSVKDDCIYINEKPVLTDQIRFSKNGHGILFIVDAKDLIPERYSIKLKNIKSVNGNVIETVDFLNCGINCEYRYLEREHEWKRF